MKSIAVLIFLLVSAFVYSADVVEPWSGESELSLVKNSGNTVSDALLAKQTLIYDMRPWRNTIRLELSNVATEIVDSSIGKKKLARTDEKYYLTEQIDKFVTERSYAFLRGSYEKDRFSGFVYQTTAVMGYGRALFDQDTFDMKTEIGLGRSSQKLDACSLAICDPDTAYGRIEKSGLLYISESLIWMLSKPAELGQDLSIEEIEGNTISRFNVYIKSQLLSSIAMKVAYAIRYSHVVPVEIKRMDEELTVSLVYSF